MLINRSLYLLLVTALLVVSACTPRVAATSVPTSAPIATVAQDEPITLRWAVADAENRASDPYVREFIEQVKMLSDGKITIEPIWDAASDTTPAFEQGVIKSLMEGQYDLGLAGARAFDTEGVTSFQALQSPFLITNDALAEAVASSEIATRMLNHVSSAGIVGLTLWPEDLRHPFSVVPGEQILSPEDFAGLNVRATPSKLTYTLLEAYGASPMLGDSDYQAAESGLRQGFSLTGTPTATGNVVFFPKFQVLFANGAAFEKLSENQQNILREAAIATQKKAIAEHPSEVEAATAWCADGGTIVLASDQQVATFEVAAQPVFDMIEQDSLNAELIAAIGELKANIEPSAGAEACGPAPLAPFDHGNIVPELIGTWSFTAFGESWTVDLSADGTFSLYAPDGQLDVGGSYGIFGSEAVFRDEIRGTGTLCSPAEGRYQWELTENRLMFTVIEDNCTVGRIEQWTAGWQKVEEQWSTGLPPNGTWQAEITTDDFVRMGVLRSVAETEWAGVYTITFQDGKYVMLWEGLQGQLGRCQAKYELVGEIVRLTLTSDPSECSWDHPDDIRWRIDDEGLHLHLVPQNSGFVEVELTAFYEAKTWQKVEEWSTGLPPNGVWQVELTADDFVQMSVMQSKANQMAGIYTWTLQDGNYILLWEDGAGKSGKCVGTYAAIDDFVRLTSTTDDCPGEVEDFQWRLDDDGLHIHLLATKNIPFIEMKANFEAKPWQKIADS